MMDRAFGKLSIRVCKVPLDEICDVLYRRVLVSL